MKINPFLVCTAITAQLPKDTEKHESNGVFYVIFPDRRELGDALEIILGVLPEENLKFAQSMGVSFSMSDVDKQQTREHIAKVLFSDDARGAELRFEFNLQGESPHLQLEIEADRSFTKQECQGFFDWAKDAILPKAALLSRATSIARLATSDKVSERLRAEVTDLVDSMLSDEIMGWLPTPAGPRVDSANDDGGFRVRISYPEKPYREKSVGAGQGSDTSRYSSCA